MMSVREGGRERSVWGVSKSFQQFSLSGTNAFGVGFSLWLRIWLETLWFMAFRHQNWQHVATTSPRAEQLRAESKSGPVSRHLAKKWASDNEKFMLTAPHDERIKSAANLWSKCNPTRSTEYKQWLYRANGISCGMTRPGCIRVSALSHTHTHTRAHVEKEAGVEPQVSHSAGR